MPNGCVITFCAHCGCWVKCHPWGDPACFYCDDCFDWWGAQEVWWQLWDVVLLRQAMHHGIQQVLADEHLGRPIATYLV